PVAAHAAIGTAGRDRRIPQVGSHGQAPHHRSPAPAGLHLSVAVRGGGTARRSGGGRGDRLHGHHLGRGVSTRGRAGAARRIGRGGRRRRCSIPVHHHGDRPRAHRRGGGCTGD